MKNSRRRRSTQIPAPSYPPDRRLVRAVALSIVLAGTLAYANSFSNPFILDDHGAVIQNRQIRTLWPPTVPLSPPAETPVARRPVVNASFAVNYAIGGLDVRGYHIGNLIIHLLSALLLFGVLRRSLVLESLASRFAADRTWIAGACALLWALHPLHTELINYVSQRTTALTNLFYLATLYCCLRAVQPHGYWRVAAVCACAAGMASKESMVTAPILVLFFDRVFRFDSLRDALRQRRRLYCGLAATWGLLALLMMSGGRTTVGFATGVSPWTYLLNQAPLLTHYLRQALWPTALVVDYGMTPAVTLAEVVWPLLAILALGAGSLLALRSFPAVGFLTTSMFILLAPTSSIVPIASEVGADRRMSLPLAALVTLLVCLVYRAGCRSRNATSGEAVPRARHAPWRVVAAAAVIVIAAALATAAFVRNQDYHSPLTLARTTVERRPHGRALYTLGYELLASGKRAEALDYFRRSARDFPAARFALGVEMAADGQFAAAMGELRAFVSLVPDAPAAASARHLIATTAMATGEYETAIAELNLALATEPHNGRIHALLGEVLLVTGAPLSSAMGHLQRAVELGPPSARVHDLIGNGLATQGRFGDALQSFRAALQIDPRYDIAARNIEKIQRLLYGSE